MHSQLILFRHGKAVNTDTCQNDEKRELTQKGIDEIKENISTLKAFIGSNQKPMIWTSPALRAKQTAQLLMNGLGMNEFCCFDFIGDGDISGLSNALLKTDGPFILIIVGHEPFLSDWGKTICGYHIPLRKGSAVCIELADAARLKGAFAWFCGSRPPAIRKQKSLQKQISYTLLFLLQEVVLAYRYFLAEPDDAEAVHKLRISIRRFRSLLSFAEPLCRREAFERLDNKMKELAERFSNLRQIDVIRNEWNVVIKNPGYTIGIDAEEGLSQVLKRERQNQKAKLLQQISTVYQNDPFGDTWKMISVDLFETETCEWNGDFLQTQTEKWERDIENRFRHIDLNRLRQTHKLRIKTKKLRYVQELLEPALGKRKEKSKLAIRLMDIIGRYLDTYANIAYLNDNRLCEASDLMRDQCNMLKAHLLKQRKAIEREAGSLNSRKRMNFT